MHDTNTSQKSMSVWASHGAVLIHAQQSGLSATSFPLILCSVGLKNELDQIPQLVADFDFEINES